MGKIALSESKISVIIRARNEAKYLEHCIEKIREQSTPVWEIILVYDTRTTDDTLEIAKRLGLQIIPINGSEFSYGRSLNIGCSAATGDFLLLVSAHAIPCDTVWLEQLMKPFVTSTVVATFSRQIPQPDAPVFLRYAMKRGFPKVGRQPCTPFSNASGVVRAPVWRLHPFDEDLVSSEDAAWADEQKKHGQHIEYCPESLIYHSHSESFQAMTKRSFMDEFALVQLGRFQCGWRRLLIRTAKNLILFPFDTCLAGPASARYSFLYRAAAIHALWLVHGRKFTPRVYLAKFSDQRLRQTNPARHPRHVTR